MGSGGPGAGRGRRRRAMRLGDPHARLGRGHADPAGLPDRGTGGRGKPDPTRLGAAGPPGAAAACPPAKRPGRRGLVRVRAGHAGARRRRGARSAARPPIRADTGSEDPVRGRGRRRAQYRAGAAGDPDGRSRGPGGVPQRPVPRPARPDRRRPPVRHHRNHPPGRRRCPRPARARRPVALRPRVAARPGTAGRLPTGATRGADRHRGRRSRSAAANRAGQRLLLCRPDRRPLPRPARLPGRRRRPPDDPARRDRHEHRHPRRLRPGVEARLGTARLGGTRNAGLL